MQTRRRFSLAGFSVALALTFIGGATILMLRYAGTALGEEQALDGSDIAVMTAVCLAIGVWFGCRQSHAVALEAIRFRQRWRRGEWSEVFGFAIGLSVAGFMLGLILSIPKWLEPPTVGATEYTLITIAACSFAGFVGGFGTQFSPVRYRHRA
jgi:hypothetical protein